MIIKEDELESIQAEAAKTIKILDFVDLQDIDPLYSQKAYITWFEQSKYTDEYRIALLDLIEQKITGESIDVVTAPAAEVIKFNGTVCAHWSDSTA